MAAITTSGTSRKRKIAPAARRLAVGADSGRIALAGWLRVAVSGPTAKVDRPDALPAQIRLFYRRHPWSRGAPYSKPQHRFASDVAGPAARRALPARGASVHHLKT